MAPSRDAEIKQVASDLDRLLDELALSVAALNGILTRPAPQGSDERLTAP